MGKDLAFCAVIRFKAVRASVFASGRDLMLVDSVTKALNNAILDLNTITIDAPSM